MKVEGMEIVRSPDHPQRVRLVAGVSYLDGAGEEYWFEVEREFEHVLSPLGNPWLVFLLPLAMVIGEPLELRLPVDPLLYENVHHLEPILKPIQAP